MRPAGGAPSPAAAGTVHAASETAELHACKRRPSASMHMHACMYVACASIYIYIHTYIQQEYKLISPINKIIRTP